ncbi:FixH protein [Rivularia sp. PCC 7116]|uniref:FixH family protein n=1 Tax=Rivularia sp. PCC 7116 TaxID=373994 RepID=UPI00029F4CAD|nr:FixH family protein [Rivularia sp. PCC 7116]AFY54310.1 FixH protein [Rivularia sp. PCC 7116]
MIKLLPLLLTLSFFTIACSTPEEAQTETQAETASTTTSGQQTENAKINLVSPNSQEAVKMGDNILVVEVIDPQTQKPVAVETLDVNVSMPMEGEEDMTSMAKVEPDAQPGRYKIKTNFGMQGKWNVVTQVKDPKLNGQANYTFDVK